MPVSWGWENGPVENAQVLVLLAGLYFACRAWRGGANSKPAMLALCVIPIWLILVGRELSWGSVFLDPLGHGPDGPIYSSRVLWYRPMVPPLAGLLVLGSLFIAWRHQLHRYLAGILAARRFPWLCVFIVLGAALGSTIGEGHLPAFARDLIARSEVLEEMAECVGYLAMVTAQGVVLRYRDASQARTPAAARAETID